MAMAMVTAHVLLRLPPDSPAAGGRPWLWRASLAMNGKRIVEVIGDRATCLAAVGLTPNPPIPAARR